MPAASAAASTFLAEQVSVRWPEKAGSLRVDYLCLQTSRQGQASYAHVHEIIAGLRRRGASVRLFEPSVEGRAPRSLREKLWSFATVQWRLWREGKKTQAVYVRAHPLAIPSLLWAKLRGIPTISELNSTYEDIFTLYPWTCLLKPLIHAIGFWCLRLSSAVVTVSEGLRAWVLQITPGALVHVIPNGANIEVFRPVRGQGPADAGTYVLFFGAMSPWQGILTLLEAVKRPEWPNDVQLLFVGDGVRREQVEAAALSDSRVRYLGRMSYTELPAVVGDALAGISPQTGTQEGVAETDRKELRAHFSPLKVYETLACGVPVIVTDFPGQADLVRARACGIVVEPSDAAAVAQAVRELAANPASAREMGERGREAVAREHSWQHRADQTLIVLESLVRDTHV